MLHQAKTSSHALFQTLASMGVDRVFLVPGESYLGLLDALIDVPEIDAVTCRHEAGAGFMAVADGRLTRKPGVFLVSRGPGATNGSIAVHTAQQDAVPLILIVGQVAERDLRREAFQEIDYQKMFGSIAKWVFECRTPAQLAEAAFKAVRVATSGVPGPVVLVIPEDIQQQPVKWPVYRVGQQIYGLPPRNIMDEIAHRLQQAKRPIVVAGGQFDRPGGRDALRVFAHHWQIPVLVSFRRHDIFPNDDALYAGDLGLSIPDAQMQMLQNSDFILALGTRLGDITTQNYQFPTYAQSTQTLLHCYPDSRLIGWDTAADFALVCDPVELVQDLVLSPAPKPDSTKQQWITSLRNHALKWSVWPNKEPQQGVSFTDVVRSVREQIDESTTVCLDAGTFAAAVYRHFNFVRGQRLMAPLSGAMGYGVPAALACAMRDPSRKVVCMVGDGGFMMTGNEMILAVKRQLPITFILANNGNYASIRLHQKRTYPGRVSGTSLHNPDFHDLAISFGMKALRITQSADIKGRIAEALSLQEPVLIEVNTSLDAVLP